MSAVTCSACGSQNEGVSFCESCGASLAATSGETPTAPPAPPGYTQPGYAPPAYGPPGYAAPGYAQPGYASPGYAPPVYAPPMYAQPMYAPAAYGSPMYVQPAVMRTDEPPTARVAMLFGIIALAAYVVAWLLSILLTVNYSWYWATWIPAVLGLLGFLSAVTAIITGHVGVYQTGARFGRPGRRKALTGMIIGYSLLALGLLMSFLLPIIMSAVLYSSFSSYTY